MSITRRSFLRRSAAAAAAFTIAPNTILGKSHGYTAPSDKLNIAAVGIGGMGHANINNVKKTENIVALCDVDWKYAKGVFDELPNAKKYYDYRKMYDEMGKDIDAVIIATADHTHAIITADAITMGKHVYCQKPLTHSVYESRLLTNLAKEYNVATQMGNQGSSDEGTDIVCEWIWNGEIGDVTRVDCATDRPIWPQGLNAPDLWPDRFNPLQQHLSSLELAWMVAFWHRRFRRYGLPHPSPTFQSIEAGLSFESGSLLYVAVTRLRPDGTAREVHVPCTRQHAEIGHAGSGSALVRRRHDARPPERFPRRKTVDGTWRRIDNLPRHKRYARLRMLRPATVPPLWTSTNQCAESMPSRGQCHEWRTRNGLGARMQGRSFQPRKTQIRLLGSRSVERDGRNGRIGSSFANPQQGIAVGRREHAIYKY